MKISVAATSFLLTILVLEMVVRMGNISSLLFTSRTEWGSLTDPNYPGAKEAFQNTYQFDEDLGYIKKSTVSEIEKMAKRQRQPSTFRILFLGDSVTELGHYADYMVSMMRQLYPNVDFEYINAGIVGYDTRQEVQLLSKYGSAISPDLVILQFSDNDVWGTPVFMKTDHGWTAYESGRYGVQVNQFWFSHSALYQVFVFYELKYRSTPSASLVRSTKMNEQNEKKYLDRFVTIVRDQHIPYRIVLSPSFPSGDPEEAAVITASYTVVMNALTAIKVNDHVIDLNKSRMMQYPREKIARDTAHPNDFGNHIMSGEIIDNLFHYADVSTRLDSLNTMQ